MRSTFHAIETAKRSLFTEQALLNTTGHNIANANTPGYSRQRVNLIESLPIEAPGMMRSNVPGQLGTGVEFTSITRVREQYLDDQYRNANRSFGDWNIQSDTLSKLETIFNEPSDTGIRTVMDNFWTAWTDLAKDPESVTGRKIVRENALALVDAFNETSKQLSDLSADLTKNIGVKADEINSITNSIANLNDQIHRLESLGDNPNDLYDQRDYLVDQLSKIVNVTVIKDPDGYTISTGGLPLVNGNQAIPVDSLSLESEYGAGRLNGGEVAGMFTSRDKYVKDYQQQLDALADTLVNGDISITIPAGSTYNGATVNVDTPITVKGINGLHKLGYLFTNPPTLAGDFFTSTGGLITAASLTLNPVIANDPMKIATSMRTDASGGTNETVKGNNTLANLMANLKTTSFKFSPTPTGNGITTGTIDDFYASMIGQLGVQSQEATRQATNLQDIVSQVDSMRQSVSGVSLDEEMSNMIMYQHAYSSAARFMTTIDETLDKLINGTGRVGL